MSSDLGRELRGYHFLDRIGGGGLGAVYAARQSTVDREVAIKIILPEIASQPEFIRRFESRARLIAHLEHPHIVPLYDYWRDPDGAYLVMRYLKGGSARTSVTEARSNLASISLILDQVASALEFAHRNNVIHCDIKPHNILRDEDGNAYLTDFGIAYVEAGERNTADGLVAGSLDYIAPEQARGERVTPCTDIYSLGIVLYELITGRHPFADASAVEKLYRHINDPLPLIGNLPPDLSDGINAVIRTSTAKNPARRYQDVGAMAAAFRQAVGLDTARTKTFTIERLTLREHEILSLIAGGLSNQEIAARLVVTVTTVKWHITGLYRKLAVRSRIQAIVRARELNLITSGLATATPTAAPVSGTYAACSETENPYKGLHAFQTVDSHDFFGREGLIAKVLTRLVDDHPHRRFLAVVGPSGSGKSSLVRAGLIPALWRGNLPGAERWFVADMIPGSHPLDKLETALVRVAIKSAEGLREQLQRDVRGLLRAADLILPNDDTELLIVVDQFEEVFTLVEDEVTRKTFLDLLYTAASDVRSRVRIVITLRADYYDRPLQYPEFGDMLRNRMETVLPLSARGIESAIRRPAERVGVFFEEGLITQIVSDMHYQTGALPLLQYALTELFERREGGKISHAAYQQIGGAVGALAKRAEDVFMHLTPEEQALTRQMFMRLVTLGEGAEDSRRRASQIELLSLTTQADTMEEIIDQLAAYRLLSLDHDPQTHLPTVEVAHEAILREWERLRTWLNESRADIRQERDLAHAADEWIGHGRDGSYLLRGARLEQIEQWQRSTHLPQTPIAKSFISASLAVRGRETQAEAARQAREVQLESRSRTMLRSLVVVFAAATIVACLLSVFALERDWQSRRSTAEFRSIALSFGAKDALDGHRPDVALALAREAVHMDRPPAAAEQMFYTAAASTWMLKRFRVSDTRVWDVVYLPDGKHMLTTSWDGRATLWDIEVGVQLQSIRRDDTPMHIAVHPDGNQVAIGGRNGLVQLWDLERNTVIDLVAGDTLHSAHTFTRDGARLLTSSDGGRVNVWDLQTTQLLRAFSAHRGNILSMHFNADDTLLATSGDDGYTRIWDVETGDLVQELDHNTIINWHSAWVWDSQFLPDQDRMLTVAGNRSLLWDWPSAEIVWSTDEGNNVQDAALSPDGKMFVVGLDNPTPVARLRDIETGELIREYWGHTQRIQNVDLSPDGTMILTGSNDGTAAIWPLRWEGAIGSFAAPSSSIIAWHPTQPLIAVAGDADAIDPDGVIRLIDTRTGALVGLLDGHRVWIGALAFTPDGRFLLSGDSGVSASRADERVYVWDLERGDRILQLEGHSLAVMDIAVSPDGRLAAVADSQGTNITLWSLESGERITVLGDHQDWVMAVDFSPDGRSIYSASRDGALYRWDVTSGAVTLRFQQNPVAINDLDLNSTGTQLLSSADDGTAIVWNVQTGERVFTLAGHQTSVNDAEFSPDGRYLMTSSADGTVILWDAQTGERLRLFVVGEDLPFLHAAFKPDGTQIASLANGILTIWDASLLTVDLDVWITANRYISDFTCEQRVLYIIEPLCIPAP